MASIWNVSGGAMTPESAAGSLVADGMGTITEWKDTRVHVAADGESTVVQPRDLVAFAASSGNAVTYEVAADCRTTIRADLGVAVIELKGALVSGGRELMATRTSPPGFVAPGVFKSVDPPASGELGAISALLERMAVRMGLRP